MSTLNRDHVRQIDHMNPAAKEAELGTLVQAMGDKFNALLAKLDADATVTDTDYAATLAVETLEDKA